MNIGELAQRAGVNVQTLRYYEKRGLVPKPARSAGNYRRYDEAAVSRVRFIKRAQALGFTLDEVADLLRLQDTSHPDPDQVREVATARLEDIERRLAELQRMRDTLRTLVTACKRRRPDLSCPILATLADESSDEPVAKASPPRRHE
jgi:MerR family transcriptional regulator, mercuric resistance operon regulatory protein